MAAAAIPVVPDDNFDDWVVRADMGQEFGHYPTREAAELVAQAIAQERKAELVVHLPDGKTSRTRFTKSWPPDCSGDDPAESGGALLHLHAVEMLAGPCQQLRQGHDTGLARNLPAVAHEHQRRYALDGEPPQQFLYGVAVDLDQSQIGLQLGCRLFEDRRHRPAGTTPDSPEINQ
jgi:hypothetical protein